MKIWKRISKELLAALIVTTVLFGFYYYLAVIAPGQMQEWLGQGGNYWPDINYKTSNKLRLTLYDIGTAVQFLSLFTTALAAYLSARNDRLTVSIRLLACLENANKFLYCLVSFSNWACEHVKIDDKRISRKLCAFMNDGVFYLDKTFNLLDIALYCQLMISLNRFMAVSFDGLYFRYTRKWPLIQLLIPYLLKIGLIFSERCIKNWAIYGEFDILYLWRFDYRETWEIWNYLTLFPQFLMCGLDFSTSRRLKQLRKDGKASRAESLLMKQMLIHSIIILFFNLFRFLAPSLVSGLFGGNLGYIVFEFIPRFKDFLLNFVGSILCAFLLRKRPENKSEERATKETTTNTSREAFSKRKQPIRSH
ncbi:unnamed protein product, partial [Mesorhabditis belari]|uniref:Uncharacterized protein n=1 Tax=Mesorhabditis belari TaxID=2138241 RepID=A0AAF3J455_9BILA